jgi:hypothetical protein
VKKAKIFAINVYVPLSTIMQLATLEIFSGEWRSGKWRVVKKWRWEKK